MRRSPQLDRVYNKFNKDYFSNKLPRAREICLRFAKITAIGYQIDEEIVLNNKFRDYPSIWMGTLLHEMTHLLLNDDPSHDKNPHGKSFQREMRRLVRLKAFDEIW